MLKKFSETLKKLRKENKETQTELANHIGVKTSSIEHYEKGRNYPEVEKLILIAMHYNVSIDWLLGYKEEKKIHIENSFNNNKGNINL